jgi:hypothetical protein
VGCLDRSGLDDGRRVTHQLGVAARLVAIPRRGAGRWDPGYGARLRDDLLAAGPVDVHADYIARSYPAGSLPARLLSLTLERLRDQLALLGASHGEIDEARRLLEESDSMVTAATSSVAQGRRPGWSSRRNPRVSSSG